MLSMSNLLNLLVVVGALVGAAAAETSVPNSFKCIDDTKFKQFIDSSGNFVVNSCPPGFCFTRNPPIKNPCIGKERALKIDGGENNAASDLPTATTTTADTLATETATATDAAADADATADATETASTTSSSSGSVPSIAGCDAQCQSLRASGGQFVTGPCSDSSECAAQCCANNQCRNVLAIATTDPVTGKFDPSTGQRYVFDIRGFSVLNLTFPSPLRKCKGNENGQLSGGSGSTSSSPAPPTSSTASGAKVCLDTGCKSTTGVDGCSPSSGTQFVTGKCAQSSECASGCCVGDLGVCRNVLALNLGVGGLARCTGNTDGMICTK